MHHRSPDYNPACISVSAGSGSDRSRQSGMTGCDGDEAANASSTAICDFPGLLVLVGAGKMGGALLEGWLRLGLDPKQVAVLEPQPAPEISALARQG